jgi:drug/metabolite transporter (DMT)-like permease
MTWFFLALLGPLLHGISSHIDRCLMQRFFTVDGAGIVLVVTCIFAGLASPVFYLLAPDVVQVPVAQLLIIGAVAVIYTGGLWAYLTALQDEDTTVVVILYQLVPVFGLGLGHLALGEAVTLRHLLATVVILLGALLVLIDRRPGRVRRRTLGLMVVASLALALGAVLFKLAAVQGQAWTVLFWQHLAYLGLGLGMVVASRPLRRQFLGLLAPGARHLLALNGLNEVVFISGNVAL